MVMVYDANYVNHLFVIFNDDDDSLTPSLEFLNVIRFSVLSSLPL